MILKDKIKELWALKQQEYAILKEIHAFEKEYLEANRKLMPGDVVEFFTDSHINVADGVIGGVVSRLHLEAMDIRDYSNGKYDPDEDISNIRYEVFARTKEGKASKKHLFAYPHHFNCFDDMAKLKPGTSSIEYVKLKQL